MTEFYHDDWLTILQGDVREVLPTLASDSVDCIVTSPPFWGLRDYGHADQIGLERTPEEYVANMVGVFRELRRVLKPSGTCWLNLGDSYFGTGRGPSNDHKPAGLHSNVTNRGEFPMNGVYTHDTLKGKDLVGIPWRVAFALQADGWYLRSDIIWSKPNPMPESVTDRPTKSHEYLFLLTKSSRYFFDADAVREPHLTNGSNGNKGSRGRIGEPGWEGGTPLNPAGRNLRSVWTIATRPYPGAHFAVFPPELPERCIKAGSSERGVCPECGAPWERVVERESSSRTTGNGWQEGRAEQISSGRRGESRPGSFESTSTTTGWRPGRAKPGTYEAEAVVNPHSERRGPKQNFGNGSNEPKVWSDRCTHEVAPVPAVVLDPFAGSGTTGMVANRLSRRAILIDLSAEYLVQQMKRNAQTPLGLGAA